MTSKSLFEILFTDYPRDDVKLMAHLKKLNDENKLLNWKDFAIALLIYFEEENMTVGKSSTWAVCKEYLGQLKGRDLSYAQSRGGIWSLDISVRDILNRFQTEYPCK